MVAYLCKEHDKFIQGLVVHSGIKLENLQSGLVVKVLLEKLKYDNTSDLNKPSKYSDCNYLGTIYITASTNRNIHV